MSMLSVPLIPESAPFSTQQRSWLNGFLAGLFGSQPASAGGGTGVPASGAMVGAKPQAPADEDTPWHDPAMPMDERLKLAEPRSFKSKVMAAMAQLDCGACGYLCKTYAEAIASGAEKDLTLCQPGGKATAMKVRELVKSRPAEDAVTVVGSPSLDVSTLTPALSLEGRGGQTTAEPKGTTDAAFTRDHPFPAPRVSNAKLNGAGSAKDTRFIAVDITGSGLKYEAGDSLGVWPENCFEHVDAILRLLNFSGAEIISTRDSKAMTLRQAMTSEFDIATPSPELFDALLRSTRDERDAADLRDLMDDKPVEGLIESPHIIDVLARFPHARPTPQELATALRRMRPRLYSISSSPKAYPNEVHLTVGIVRYEKDGRARKGVTSTYLADRVLPRQPVRVFVNPSHFRPPTNPDAPMIMIGPGTGIAPFRAFLQERLATGAKGKNWLFFGDQRSATDFLYRDELEHWHQSGLLTRLDTAFSRDSDAKVYVQHRMMEQAAEIWSWLQEGGCVYVCGDAKRMAADVDQALTSIASQHLGAAAAAKEFVAKLAKEGRYQRDVY